jgi:hypothetical protein
MPAEPAAKRAIAFLDGQNLFYAAKHAFGYLWPNYDPLKLAHLVCQAVTVRQSTCRPEIRHPEVSLGRGNRGRE